MKHPALKLEDIISHEICLTDIEKRDRHDEEKRGDENHCLSGIKE